MTALQTISKGASALPHFYAHAGFADSDAITGLWLPRSGLARARRNLAPDVAEAVREGTVVGVPTYSSGFASFVSNTDYFLTNVDETATMTVCIVAKTDAAGTSNSTRPIFVGNYDGTSGFMMYLTSSGSDLFMRGQCYDGSNTNRTRVINITATKTSWAYYALVISPSAITLYNRTHSASSTLAITGRTVSTKKIAIGSGRSSAFTSGDCDIAAVLVANIAATTTQLDNWESTLNTELADFSIAV
jgi:hypothetical protein